MRGLPKEADGHTLPFFAARGPLRVLVPKAIALPMDGIERWKQ